MQKILQNEGIEVLIPEYEENIGDCTKIITNHEETIINKSIKSCINLIADYYCINLKSNRKYYGRELGIKNNVPIIINSQIIYIPFKARKPLCKNDSASGYINIMSISKITEQNKKGIFITKRNKKIITYQTEITLRKEINYGKLAKLLYYQKNYNQTNIAENPELYKTNK